MSSEGIIMDQNIYAAATFDIAGDPIQIAIAWAAAAYGPAGPYWPAAFGFVVGTTRVPMTTDHARRWLREVIRETDHLVDDLVLLEREVSLMGPAPKEPDCWETDNGWHMAWDTSVSLVLSFSEDEPNRLRLVLYGEHEQRLSLIREALERPARAVGHIIRAWRDIVSESANVLRQCLTDDERALLSSVSAERLAALAAYRRLAGD